MNKTTRPDRKRLGSDLCPADRQQALACYVNRYTRDHKPTWAGSTDPVQFASDADWLANTFFAVRADGRFDSRFRFCESRPTWPDNPELRACREGHPWPNRVHVFCPVPEK